MKLIIISPPGNFPQEQATLRRMMELEGFSFHVRKPEAGYDELRRYIQSLPPEFHNRLVLHSHHGLLEEFGLKGIHFTSSMSYTYDKGERISRSISRHSIEELEEAEKLKGLSYAFLSPVFDSISKKEHKAAFRKEVLESYLKRRERTLDIIALGGIKPENIGQLEEMGFEGLAVLGSVWMSPDPFSSLKDFIKKCGSQKVSVN